jgi:hypothetical protein
MKAHSSAKPEHSRHHGSSDRSGHGHGQQATAVVDNRPEMEQQQGLLSLMAGSPRLQRKSACGAPSAAGGSCTACEAKASGAGSQAAQLLPGPAGLTGGSSSPSSLGLVPAAALEPTLDDEAPPHSLTQVPALPVSIAIAVWQQGRPLAQPLRTQAESFFGQSLGHVRIHDDAHAATAAVRHRAHAIAAGPHILLSRQRSDLSRSESQRTLAHEIAHTLQPQTGTTSSDPFDAPGSAAEVAAHSASKAFLDGSARFDPSARPTRRGLSLERDPRLDALVSLIDSMPVAWNAHTVARKLQHATPDLNIRDPDNFQPLLLVVEDHFAQSFGQEVLSEWYLLRSGLPPAARVEPATLRTPRVIDPGSMSGTELETEIGEIRSKIGVLPLDPDAPAEEAFEPHSAEDGRNLARLQALETEYFEHHRVGLDAGREFIAAEERRQRSKPRAGVREYLHSAVSLGFGVPGTLQLYTSDTALGHPVEDAATGFVAGFLGGVMLELPRDVFARLDAEIREHPVQFNFGAEAGLLLGAAKGLKDFFAGLIELLEMLYQVSPVGLVNHGFEELVQYVSDPEAYSKRRRAQHQRSVEIAKAILGVVQGMFNDPAFMLAHGREFGELSGRASGQWFHGDFMNRTTFRKGLAVGEVEGRIVFEIVALFLGPEEWIARGAVVVSGPLRLAILKLIQRYPVLRRLMLASREASTVARDAAAGERALAGGGEAVSDLGRGGEALGDLGRGGGAVGDETRALEGAVNEGGDALRAAKEKYPAAKPTAKASEPIVAPAAEPHTLDAKTSEPHPQAKTMEPHKPITEPEPVGNGHHVQMTHEGFELCSPAPCPNLRLMYKEQLAASEELNREMERLEAMRKIAVRQEALLGKTDPAFAKRINREAAELQKKLEAAAIGKPPISAAAAPSPTASKRLGKPLPEGYVDDAIKRLDDTNAFEPHFSEKRAAQIKSGEKNFTLDQPMTPGDIDEPLSVGAKGIKPQRAVDRATDPHNHQFLDASTNRQTKHLGTDSRDVARGRNKLEPVSLTKDPDALINRRFDEIEEMAEIFDQAVNRVKNKGELKPTALKNRINAEIRDIIKNGDAPAARTVRDVLKNKGFVFRENVGFVLEKVP